jgi:hypothetical protein
VKEEQEMVIKRAWVVVVLAILLLNAQNVHAQDSSKKQLDSKITAAIGFVVNRAPAPFSRGRNLGLFALAIALRKQTAVFVAAAEDARVDKQVGGGDSNVGSTSLVSKGSIPSILGYAVENGALAREVSGTTITFRGNPVGIVKALSSAGFIEGYQNSDTGIQFLRRFSFALSFDASRGQPGNTSGSAVFTGDRQQLSSYSLRCDIVNHRDPRDKAYNEAWHQLIAKDLTTLSDAVRLLDDALDKDDAFIAWHANANAKVEAASASGASEKDVDKLIRSELEKLASLTLSPEADSLAEAFAKSYKAFLQSRGSILDTISKGPIVTFEYTNIRNVDAVDQSNFKLIAEGAFFNGRADLTANGSLTILNKIPGGTKLDRVQDVDLSGQLDLPLGEIQKIGSIVLSFSGKYKHMMQDTMMASGMMADTKGDIGVGQVKLTIPVKGSGVRIPISFTFANRTELIKEKIVRGNIGITFDLDSIFARLKP